MADESLNWELKIQDLMSGPLGRIEKQVDDLSRAMGTLKTRSGDAERVQAKISQALGRGRAQLLSARGSFGKAWGSLLGGGATEGLALRLGRTLGYTGRGFKSLSGAASSFGAAISARVAPALRGLGGHLRSALPGLATMGTVLTAGATALVGAAGKWAIGGLAFKEDSLTAFKTMLGTQQAAQRTFDWATKFAATTPFSSEQVIANTQRLLTGGFKENELDTLMKAVGDVGANMGDQKMEQVITAIVQTKAKGKLQGEEMMQLAEGGVGQTAVFEALARNLGISKTEAQSRVSAGRVTGDQGVAAIIEAIRVTQSGGELGGAMGAKSKTLTGLFSSLKDVPSSLLYAADTDGVLAPIKRLMSGIIASFEKGGPLFDRATAMFDRVSKAWAKTFDTLADGGVEDVLGSIIDSIGSFFESAAPFAQGFFPELMNQFQTLFKAFGVGGDAGNMVETGKAVAQLLGVLGTGLILLGKALFFAVTKIMQVLDWLGLGSAGAKSVVDKLNPVMSDAELERAAAEGRRDYEARRTEGLRGTPMSSLVSGFHAGGGAGAGRSLSNVGNVAAVTVQVQPGDEQAGVSVAKQVIGALPTMLVDWATEHAG